jgi:hypothetical protein
MIAAFSPASISDFRFIHVRGSSKLDRAKFAHAFAADVTPAEAAFMADSQVPWSVNALSGSVTEPAWKSKRSWYLVTTEDKLIPSPAQRQMAQRAGSVVVETKDSHAIYVSQSQAVIKLIAGSSNSMKQRIFSN